MEVLNKKKWPEQFKPFNSSLKISVFFYLFNLSAITPKETAILDIMFK